MSAVFGFLQRDGRHASPAALRQMESALRHRGPDGIASLCEGPAALGNCLLRTDAALRVEHFLLRDLPAGRILAADARVDNREELWGRLHRPRPATPQHDGALILASYERWGERCVEHFVGDFAFAIWDSREQALLLARDQLGVRPLYYHASPGLVVFATTLPGLLAHPAVPRRTSELQIAEHLTGFIDDPELTFFADVLRLPAAHTLRITSERSARRRYWSLDPQREIRLANTAAYADAFRDLFTEAVRCRSRTSFPLGATLSGGLDSSSIACVARLQPAASSSALHTFSAIFPSYSGAEAARIDERRYIEAVVAAGGIESHLVCADTLSPLQHVAAMLRHAGGLFTGPNLYLHWGLFRAAQNAGVRVLLEGTDGDTTVSHGLHFLAELALSGRWLRLYREAGKIAWRTGWATSRADLIATYVLKPVSAPLRRLRTGGCSDSLALIDPAFARRSGLAERRRALGAGQRLPPATLRAHHWQSLSAPALTAVLELADWTGAAFGLELRFPFCDRRLVEFCLALPADQKLADGWTRAVLRRAMSGILPERVRTRLSKANLSLNFVRGLQHADRPLLETTLAEGEARIAPYVDMGRLRACRSQLVSGQQAEGAAALALYTATTLALALRPEHGAAAPTPEFTRASVGPAELGLSPGGTR
jgi:asparagine synthase (glutamine-hydrolysing)